MALSSLACCILAVRAMKKRISLLSLGMILCFSGTPHANMGIRQGDLDLGGDVSGSDSAVIAEGFGRADRISDPQVEPTVVYAPNCGSVDMLDLFDHPEQWPTVRENIDLFGFHGWSLITPGSYNDLAGRNIIANFIAVDAFAKLATWGIGVHIEGWCDFRHYDPQSDDGCESLESWGARWAAYNSAMIDAVEENGGTVASLAMHEPLIVLRGDGYPCPADDIQQAAEAAAYSVALLKSAHPDVMVGNLIVYKVSALDGTILVDSGFSVDEIKEFVEAAKSAGWSMPYLWLDVNGGLIQQSTYLGVPVDPRGDFQELQSFCHDQDVRLGVFFTDATWDYLSGSFNPHTGMPIYLPGYDSACYHSNTMEFVGLVASAIGAPDDWVFESWRESVDPDDPNGFVRQLPRNLDENDPHSHTNLVNAGVETLTNGPGALMCEPCETDEDCHGDAACLSFPDGALFCAEACDPEWCPLGYSCYDTSGGSGTSHHCAPTAGDVCSQCEPWACPRAAIFSDGFESGDSTQWSATVPRPVRSHPPTQQSCF